MSEREATTLYLERSKVREVLIGQPDETLQVTESILCEIDALPAFTAADIGGPAQGAVKLDPLPTDKYVVDDPWYRPAQRPGTPEDWVLVPRKLTAENGAKTALIGYFSEAFECLDDDGDECTAHIPVSWTTIKEIHKAMVKHFASAHTSTGRLTATDDGPKPTCTFCDRSVFGPCTSRAMAAGCELPPLTEGK